MTDFYYRIPSGGQALGCHTCGHPNTHQREVTVFNRTEDARDVMVTTVSGDNVEQEVLIDPPHNPSDRRYGVRIRMECETEECPGYNLLIYQHKGDTFFEAETLQTIIQTVRRRYGD